MTESPWKLDENHVWPETKLVKATTNLRPQVKFVFNNEEDRAQLLDDENFFAFESDITHEFSEEVPAGYVRQYEEGYPNFVENTIDGMLSDYVLMDKPKIKISYMPME